MNADPIPTDTLELARFIGRLKVQLADEHAARLAEARANSQLAAEVGRLRDSESIRTITAEATQSALSQLLRDKHELEQSLKGANATSKTIIDRAYAEIDGLKAEVDRLRADIAGAISYAGGRESEWGERAEFCFEILNAALVKTCSASSQKPDSIPHSEKPITTE